jgi:predicted transcriptional regulator YdeE
MTMPANTNSEVRTTTQARQVLGWCLRTSNARAFEDIPGHWGRFFQQGGLASVPGCLGPDVFAIYTDFAHPGVDNLGDYSLIVGGLVQGLREAPAGMALVTIPPGTWAVVDVATGHPEQVGARWQDIWADTHMAKAFRLDFEHYHASGKIEIHVGLRT